ncbi:hypothetical protein GN956_G24002 [Arapaima gigas]
MCTNNKMPTMMGDEQRSGTQIRSAGLMLDRAEVPVDESVKRNLCQRQHSLGGQLLKARFPIPVNCPS